MKKWLSFFDYQQGLITVLLFDQWPFSNGKGDFVLVDESISDPGGLFTVYVDRVSNVDVAFVMRMRQGTNVPDVVHKSFNPETLSVRTLWVPRHNPEKSNWQPSLSHMWISKVKSPWKDETRPTLWEPRNFI
jgi:hypothetical protein